MYWVIHLKETDGEIILWPCPDMDSVKAYVRFSELHALDYAVIHGDKLKGFNSYTTSTIK